MSSELALPNTGQLSVFSTEGFELVQRMAKAFSSSSLVPKHYQGQANIGNCIIALNMAQRIGSDPLMTMQNLYVVHGNPAWSSQFLIATFNSCGRFAPIRYRFEGKENTDAWGCRAVTRDRETDEEIVGSLVTIKLAKEEGWYTKAGSKWKTMPEQMLRYRAAAWLIRSIAPEIAMGLHTVEEVSDTCEGERQPRRVRVIPASEILGDTEIVDDEPGEYEIPAPPAAVAPAPPSEFEQFCDLLKDATAIEASPVIEAAKKAVKAGRMTAAELKHLEGMVG